jgi:hypothetical protein
MNAGYVRVPNATMFASLPFEERTRLYTALKELLAAWAATELDRTTT